MSSKQQPTIALFSYKTEYMGQTKATKKAGWLKLLLQQLNTPYTIGITGDPSIYLAIYSLIIYCDN